MGKMSESIRDVSVFKDAVFKALRDIQLVISGLLKVQKHVRLLQEFSLNLIFFYFSVHFYSV